MKTAVLTGATGFVGGALARALADDGVAIRALTRPQSDRGRLDGVPVTWVTGDVLDPASLRGLFDGADRVIHAAGMLGQFGVTEAAYNRLHVDGTRNVLAEVARSSGNGRPRVLYVSSPGVLGPIDSPPADETTPLAPSNPYERSKAAAELVAQEFFAAGMDLVIARPEFIYGPGDRHVLGLFRAVQRGLYFYIGDGRATCHPTYIADAVDGLLRCLRRGETGEIYHIAGPRPVTFRELGEAIATALDAPPPSIRLPRALAWIGAAVLEFAAGLVGREPPLSRTGVAFFSENRRFSWRKAQRELGYEPQFDLATGVQATVAWYRQQGRL